LNPDVTVPILAIFFGYYGARIPVRKPVVCSGGFLSLSTTRNKNEKDLTVIG